jgi:DNA repair exonuclease SbcCD ATPase subunit
MKIVNLNITGFGPLSEITLDFADGLNVIYGPNESAKTATHAAIFAGLCGIRRGQGQPAKEDKRFEKRHKPWNGGPWQVAALVELADGRRVRLTHDLADKVGSKAIDETNGTDVSSEIGYEGSIDGSVWLGLNRRSFRTTACVRQAEIVAAVIDDEEYEQDHRALQEALQRAATSASQRDETAGAALRALETFWGEKVGRDDARSANRPFRRSKAKVDECELALHNAEQAHAQYLDVLVQRDDAIVGRDRLRREVKLAEAVVARAEALALEQRAAKARELAQRYPEKPGGMAAVQALGDEVSEALTLWHSAPAAQDLTGDTSAQIEAMIDDLPERPTGELTPAQEVLDVVGHVEVARTLLREHGDEPEVVTQAAPAAPVMSPAAYNWARARVPMIAVAAFGIAGIVALVSGAAAVGAVLLVGAVAAAGATFWFLRPTAASVSLPIVLPTQDPAVAVGDRTQQLIRKVDEAEQTLAEALARHGVSLNESETLDAAISRYRDECAAREAQDHGARQREALLVVLQQRRTAEQHQTRRQEGITALRIVATKTGIVELDPEVIATSLHNWQNERQSETEEHDEARQEWAELEAALGDETLDDLIVAAERSREIADEASAGFAADKLAGLDLGAARSKLPQLRKEHQEAFGEAERQSERATAEGATLKPVAEAEAELDEAREELARIRRLDETLKTTIDFLTEAQRRIYASIAPELTTTLKAWLPRVVISKSGGMPAPRYDDVQIDPQTLAVRVRASGGAQWCDAELLSAGTREQIYLLLRAALAEHLVKDGEVVPLLLDEVTAQADSTRRTALLELIKELSASRQIILFSHDDAVFEWAHQNLPIDAVHRMGPVGVSV